VRAIRCLLAVALVVTLTAVPAGAQRKLPPDFAIPAGEASPGPVSFSHTTHVPKVGKCTTCHMKDLKMKRGGSGPITLDAKQEGKFCGACHDGETVMGGGAVFAIDECDKCHR
jgi:c(7)-type cytochrome triheme protein